MHWASHCEAYYATWIVRYLDPRRSPWKKVLRHWIEDEYIPQATLLAAAPDRDRSHNLPLTATYVRRCLRAFAALQITQNLDLLDFRVQAEPLWYNNRFYIDLPLDRVTIWQGR